MLGIEVSTGPKLRLQRSFEPPCSSTSMTRIVAALGGAGHKKFWRSERR